MKNIVLCVIYDLVSVEYSMPISFNNVDCAKRYFQQLKTKNPNYTDLELYYIGNYNNESAEITLVPKTLLMRGE